MFLGSNIAPTSTGQALYEQKSLETSAEPQAERVELSSEEVAFVEDLFIGLYSLSHYDRDSSTIFKTPKNPNGLDAAYVSDIIKEAIIDIKTMLSRFQRTEEENTRFSRLVGIFGPTLFVDQAQSDIHDAMKFTTPIGVMQNYFSNYWTDLYVCTYRKYEKPKAYDVKVPQWYKPEIGHPIGTPPDSYKDEVDWRTRHAAHNHAIQEIGQRVTAEGVSPVNNDDLLRRLVPLMLLYGVPNDRLTDDLIQ